MAPKVSSSSLRNFIATTQGKSYTVGAVTVLLVLFIFLLGIFPAISSIFLQADTNNSRTAALDSIETKRLTLRALIAEEQSKRAVSLSLNANLPENLDQAALLTQLDKLVASANCFLLSVTFNDLEARRDFVSAFGASQSLDGKILNMSVEGDRPQLEVFLSSVETSRRIMNVRNISILRKDSQASENDRTGQYRMDLQFEVYFWNKNKAK